MPGVTGHGILSRVRSHRKMRTEIPAEEMETPKLLITHRRQYSDGATVSRSSSTRLDFRGHYPPIEFDPLKLNPPVPDAPHAPPRLHERQTLGSMRTKRSIANRRPTRLHRSESGFSLDGYEAFDFSLEKDKALRMIDRNRQREHDVAMKGWPSPASSVDSVDSGKSWFDDDDSQDEDDFVVPNPQRRPPVGSPDDPTNFIKRGEWKRRGIFFGVQAEEVHTKDDEAFEV